MSKNINLEKAGVSSSISGGTENGFNLAIAEILKFDGVEVSVDQKAKSLIKFGENDTLQQNVEQMVWRTGGLETLPTTNAIDSVISSNAGDTQDIVIEGHTVDGSGNFTFVTQTATLTGLTKVVLTTPLARSSRMYNNDSTDFIGTIRVYEDGADDHLTIEPSFTDNQSEKCATTISSQDYWLITSFIVGVDAGTNATVSFRIRVGEKGKVHRMKYRMSATGTSGTVTTRFEEPLIIPPNADVYVTAVSDTNNTKVDASLHGQLAIII